MTFIASWFTHDDAGAAARGIKHCTGMTAWCVDLDTGERITLRALKERSLASGLFPPGRGPNL